MIILRMHKGHVISGACTECGPSTSGILSIPVELDFDMTSEVDDREDAFVAALVEAFKKPLSPGAGRWFPEKGDR